MLRRLPKSAQRAMGIPMRCVDEGESEARQHAELAVAELQVFNDVCRQDVDYLAVDEVENVNDGQQSQYQVERYEGLRGFGNCLLRVGQC